MIFFSSLLTVFVVAVTVRQSHGNTKDCSYNELASIGCSCDQKPTIFRVSCPGGARINGFLELPPPVKYLKKEISIEDQYIPILKKSFFANKLYNISKLSLNNCQIREIEDEFLSGTVVAEKIVLSLRDNRLKALHPNVFGAALEFEELDLSGNEFTGVPSKALIRTRGITSLDLGRNRIKNITKNAFGSSETQPVKNLKRLILSRNEIDLVENYAFNNTRFLESLDLSHNRVQRITRDIFSGTVNQYRLTLDQLNTYLIDIYLQYNEIAEIEPGAFRILKGWRDIHLDHNKLRIIRNGTFVLLGKKNLNSEVYEKYRMGLGGTSISKVSLSHNEIQDIEEDAFEIDIEHELDLSHNRLTKVEEHYFAKVNLTTKHEKKVPFLDLSYNQINETAPNALKHLVNLRRILLNSNQLKELPDDFFTIANGSLNELHLESNALERIPRGIDNHPYQIDTLLIGYNNLREIGKEDFKNFPELKYLHLSYNRNLSIFHREALTYTPRLRDLVMEFCDIPRLPDLKNHNELGEINVEGNRISELPRNFCKNQRNLIEFFFGSNEFTAFPDLSKCKVLDTIELHNNKITEIPEDAIHELNYLDAFVIAGNQLTSLPPKLLHKTPRLKEFSAAFNKLSDIPEGFFSEVPGLTELSLAHNQITIIRKGVFANLHCLKDLFLNDNKIQTIEEGAYVNGTFHYLEKLHLSNNDFNHLPTPGEGFPNLRELHLANCPNLWNVPPPQKTPALSHSLYTYPYHCCLWKGQLEEDWFLRDSTHYNNPYDIGRHESVTRATPQTTEPPTTQLPTISETTISPDEFFEWLKKYTSVAPDAVNITFVNETTVVDDVDHVVFKRKKEAINDISFVTCYPRFHPLTPCEDLMGSWVLRVFVWAVIILALSGNAAVLFVMLASRKGIDPPQFFISNLAFADLCLGIYLAFIGVVDLQTYGDQRFFLSAISWQMGPGCKTAGFFAIFSTELSLYLLVLITLERVFTIAHARQKRNFTMKKAVVAMAIGWVFAIGIALLPILDINSYSSVAVCLPFRLESLKDKLFIVFLVGLNIIGVVIIFFSYVAIYRMFKKSPPANDMSSTKRLLKVMAMLIVVDFFCWAPLSIVTVMSLVDPSILTTSQAKWFIVLVYPINACANPFLYAIFTRNFKERVKSLCCSNKHGEAQRHLQGGRHRTNLGHRRASISIAEMQRRVSSGSFDPANIPARGRTNSIQPLLNQASSLLSNSDQTSITSGTSSTIPILHRRTSLPNNVAPNPPVNNDLCSGNASDLEVGELYIRLFPPIKFPSNNSGSLPNLHETTFSDPCSPPGHTFITNNPLHTLTPCANNPLHTLSPGEHHPTCLSTVEEASEENLHSHINSSESQSHIPEPLSLKEMGPLSQSIHNELKVLQDGGKACPSNPSSSSISTCAAECMLSSSPHRTLATGSNLNSGSEISIGPQSSTCNSSGASTLESNQKGSYVLNLDKAPWTLQQKDPYDDPPATYDESYQSIESLSIPTKPDGEMFLGHRVIFNPRFRIDSNIPQSEV